MPGTGTATIDFGATPTDGATFTVTDASISSTSYVEAYIQHGDSTADNTVDDHEIAAASLRLSAFPATGNFSLAAHCLFGAVTGQMKIRYAWS